MRLLRLTVLVGIAFSFAACSDDGSPSAPISARSTVIDSVALSFGGTDWAGGVIAGDVGSTLFTIHLRDRDQLHLQSVEQCSISYDRPGPGMNGSRHTGTRLCLDDGANGDMLAGDGICSYFDADDAIGCGRGVMPAGEYEYMFTCQFSDGSVSQMSQTVTRQ